MGAAAVLVVGTATAAATGAELGTAGEGGTVEVVVAGVEVVVAGGVVVVVVVVDDDEVVVAVVGTTALPAGFGFEFKVLRGIEGESSSLAAAAATRRVVVVALVGGVGTSRQVRSMVDWA